MKLALLVLGFAVPVFGDCLSAYHVRRLVAPMIYHEFLGIETQSEALAFGLTKGTDDQNFFEAQLKDGEGLTYLGSACGWRAEKAIEIAEDLSAAWRARYQSWLPFLTRIAVTPLMGKPCRSSALDIESQIAPLLN